MDFVWFVFNYFSISLLAKTLFYPWKRIGERRSKFFDPTFLIIDFIMRTVGFLFRTIAIIVGSVAVLLAVIIGPFFIIGWILFPIIILLLLGNGINLLLR